MYVYTRMFPCASAHRETRWNKSKLAMIVSGSDPTVLSQMLSQILSQILSQLPSQLRSQLASGKLGLSKSGHYHILQALPLLKSGKL